MEIIEPVSTDIIHKMADADHMEGIVQTFLTYFLLDLLLCRDSVSVVWNRDGGGTCIPET